MHLQICGLLDVAHTVHVRVLRRKRLLHRFDVLTQTVDERAAIISPPLLEPPAGELKETGPRRLARGIIRIEVLLEDIAPERRTLRRHAAELETAAGTE